MKRKTSIFTISALATELGRDRRKLTAVLRTVEPDGITDRGHPGWLIKTAIEALAGDGMELNPAAEKARLDKARADLAELDLATRQARLVPAEMIEKAWGNIVTEIRTRLMSIPASVAPRVTPKMSTVEIEAIIREQVDEALKALAGAAIVQEPEGQVLQ